MIDEIIYHKGEIKRFCKWDRKEFFVKSEKSQKLFCSDSCRNKSFQKKRKEIYEEYKNNIGKKY